MIGRRIFKYDQAQGRVVEITAQELTPRCEVNQTNRRYEHTAHSLPPWDPRAPRHDAEGQPVFLSKKEIDEYAARTGKSYI